jgi:hypothetical protein
MVQGPKSAAEAVRLLRKKTRETDSSWSVAEITDGRGRRRGKGSHVMWAIYDKEGSELARGSVTNHPGDMSWTVTRGFENDFAPLLGEGWMDQ